MQSPALNRLSTHSCRRKIPMTHALAVPFRNLASSMLTALALAGEPHPAAVTATLSEWKVELSDRRIAPGFVTFTVMNAGSIPHALEVEGEGIEQETAVIQPGAHTTLTLTLKPGTYEVYCPVGEDSHKKLGMDARLKVEGGSEGTMAMPETHAMSAAASAIQVSGGGPVIQILPGPFPFPDSAAPILQAFGAEREGLAAQVK